VIYTNLFLLVQYTSIYSCSKYDFFSIQKFPRLPPFCAL